MTSRGVAVDAAAADNRSQAANVLPIHGPPVWSLGASTMPPRIRATAANFRPGGGRRRRTIRGHGRSGMLVIRRDPEPLVVGVDLGATWIRVQARRDARYRARHAPGLSSAGSRKTFAQHLGAAR